MPRTPTTLRRKIVLAVVGLVAASSILICVVSVLTLRTSLMERLDQQLSASFERASSQVTGTGPTGGMLPAPGEQLIPSAERILYGPAQAEGTLALVVNDGTITQGYFDEYGQIASLNTEQLTKLSTLKIDGKPYTMDLGSGLGDYRLMGGHGNNVAFVVGTPMNDVNGTVSQLTWTVGIIATIAAAIVALVAATFIRAAMRPLERVSAAAVRVSQLELDRGSVENFEPVSTDGVEADSEVGQVVTAFNTMLDNVGTALVAREQSENKVRRFVADASHELRTPLASIRGYSELIRRIGGDSNPDITRSLERIESESIRMTGLVEDLLLLARLDEGRELVRGDVDLSQIVLDAVSDAIVTSPDHEWELELADEPVHIIGDSARLSQVVVNLVANARTHTPAGTEVTVSLETVEENGSSCARLVVADNGQGIDPERVDHLFERFVRADESRARTTGSTGLGLAIVEAIVHAHDGTVSVTSKPGDTRFTVTLPSVRPSTVPQGQPSGESREPSTESSPEAA
ncbi:HAMP domain-containing sensor histidine kinase [Lysinibacter cavernae]|uniref:histidine kinase n=1 Tax=Lysinibacter cavernae TaxID=1640652 RepID=A0A7X5R1X4_9MICO|nr:HAMP domain-containing sensor histidine kinase [Lysinibacter cavernae]NIH54106.1 two-component system OmpR family sensor kinase [Lysinibacter cavernae]